MRRTFVMAALAAVMLTGGAASADPIKGNGVLMVPLACEGQSYTIAIKGQGIAGHIVGGEGNIQPVEDTVTYTYADPATGEPVSTTVEDQLGRGHKTGLQEDLVTCTGATDYEDPALGRVTADFEIRAFITPRNE